MIATVTKDDLVALGFSEGTSRSIIRNGETPPRSTWVLCL